MPHFQCAANDVCRFQLPADGETYKIIARAVLNNGTESDNDVVQNTVVSTPGSALGVTKFVYKNAASQPTSPTSLDPNPSGWATAPTTPPGGQFTWVSLARLSLDGTTVLEDWSSPFKWSGEPGQDGSDGADGADAHGKEYIFTSHSAATEVAGSKQPSDSWGFYNPGTADSQTYTDGASTIDASNPYLHRYSRAIEGAPAFDDAVTDTWSWDGVVGRYGDDGSDGADGIDAVPPGIRVATGGVLECKITENRAAGSTNAGEIEFTQGDFVLPDQTTVRTINTSTADLYTPWEGANDPRDDRFYIVWGATDAETRFGWANQPGTACDFGLFTATFDAAAGQWYAHENSDATGDSFTPVSTDYVIAMGYKAPADTDITYINVFASPAGADGSDAYGKEYIFTSHSAATEVAGSKQPDDAWGFDNPGTADGQVYTDGSSAIDATEILRSRGVKTTIIGEAFGLTRSAVSAVATRRYYSYVE